jgi:glutamine synthetase
MRAMPDTKTKLPDEVARFLKAHPRAVAVDLFFADLAGVVRGKRYPIAQLPKLYESGAALPGSVFLLSAEGATINPEGRGFDDGDPDELVKLIPDSLQPVPWAEPPRAQAMITLEAPDGTPYPFEPRNVLKRTLARLGELKLRPVVAFELEFYLIDRHRTESGAPQAPLSPVTGLRDTATQVYGMAAVDDFAGFLEEVAAACATQGLATGAITAEHSPGQFEINLQHEDDPLAAADHCVMFKRAVQGVARRHGIQATFMAKPYLENAGSGLHLHISLLDDKGRNVFSGGKNDKDRAGPVLKQALGGILELMPDSMAILAPNVNSYRRFKRDNFVPTRRSWAFENRSVALRIPISGGPAARRIEHRVAGADANPYLVLATALAGIHHGIENRLDPGPPFEGNACTEYDPEVPFRPLRAFDRMAESKVLADYFGADYVSAYVACKAKELEAFESEMSPAEYRWYLIAD